MTITNDTNAAMQYYVDRLRNGPLNDKRVQNHVNEKFNVSGVAIRKKLIEDGVIKMTVGRYDAERQRKIFIVELIDESKLKFVDDAPKQLSKPIVFDSKWPEGHSRSYGNAFDWRNYAKGLFSKQELAAMQQKIKSNPAFSSGGIHIYSKA